MAVICGLGFLWLPTRMFRCWQMSYSGRSAFIAKVIRGGAFGRAPAELLTLMG